MPTPEAGRGTLKTYITGFALSVLLTLAAYFFTTQHVFSSSKLIGIILGLAILQFVVQLVFFLHLGRESKPRWNLVVLLFMLMVLGILVLGSLWIMNHLNYNMQHSSDNYIIKDEGISH